MVGVNIASLDLLFVKVIRDLESWLNSTSILFSQSFNFRTVGTESQERRGNEKPSGQRDAHSLIHIQCLFIALQHGTFLCSAHLISIQCDILLHTTFPSKFLPFLCVKTACLRKTAGLRGRRMLWICSQHYRAAVSLTDSLQSCLDK